jgi:four helix bundle protein
MNPKATALQRRMRAFLVRLIRFCEALTPTAGSKRISPQLIDAAGATSSNYNGACRARSRREFAAKIGVAAEEASEALEWLLSLKDAGIGDRAECDALIQEAGELTAILTSSHKTATRR